MFRINPLLMVEWQDRLANYHTLYVGFSGGLDSTVLLHMLVSQPLLRNHLKAVHVHHGLSINADAWQSHCLAVCGALQVPLVVCPVKVDGRANIEERARDARYQAFSTLLSKEDALLLAHHCDDQAETLLLQLFRGAGINGLSAMTAVTSLEKGDLIRPLLQHSRQQLEAYATAHQLAWIDDESNENSDFSRNYLRHQVIPLLQKKWPNVVENLGRTAKHCQQAKKNLAELARQDHQDLNIRNYTLALTPLQDLEPHRLVNVLREWLVHHDVRFPSTSILNRLIHEVIFARTDATPIVQWGEVSVRRYQQSLYLLTEGNQPLKRSVIEWTTFPDPIDNLGVSSSQKGIKIQPGQHLQVRFRQGGELFLWRGQTKQLKKLWQQWRVPPWQRDFIPLLYVDGVLAAVVGFAISDRHFSEDNEHTYGIVIDNIK